jgi:cathepsin B
MKLVLLLALVALSVLGHRFEESSESDEDLFKLNPPSNRQSVLDQYRNRVIPKEAEDLTGDALIRYVNRKQNLWTARRHRRFDRYPDRTKWGLMGVKNVRLPIAGLMSTAESENLDIYIPENFDSRQQWDYCDSIKIVRDQSSCGSCWAFGAVEAMSDRICIASKGKIQVSLSADDLLSCCKSCGFGCDGGDPLAAWKYWVRDGIVTGSNYTTKEGCKPYPFPPCEHHSNKTHYDPCKHDLYPTPRCERTCQDGYDKTYKKDLYFGKSAYGVKRNVEAIQKEILTNGPVEVAFEVYEDFLNYDGGVYVHTGGKLGGGHAVKMIGWGMEKGVPYWLVVNSWNQDWGEDGLFRIIRGVDECGIESGVVGGVPRLDKHRISRHVLKQEDSESEE